MKKKIFSIILALCFCLSIFTGCDLFGTDQKAVAQSVVATISYSDGTSKDITRLELDMAYRSYGYNYSQDYSQAMQMSLNSVIENKLLARIVEEYYKSNNIDLLDQHEKTYLWDQTYDALKSNLKQYKNATEETNSTPENNSAIFKDYEKQVELKKNPDGSYTILRLDANTTIRGHYGEEYGQYRDFEAEDGEDKKLLITRIKDLLSDNEWEVAFNKYIKAVKENYSYLYNYSTNDEWFEFETKRIYDILKDNYMVEKFDTTFNAMSEDGTVSNVSVQKILDTYADKVSADFATYGKANSNFNSSVVSDFANMDYFRTDVDVFNLAYIKFALTTGENGETEQLAALKTSADYNEKTRPEAIDNFYNSISATNHVDNTKTEKVVNVLDNLQKQLDKMDVDRKIEIFRDYMYKYSDDETLKGAEFNAAFGFTRDGEYLSNSNFSGEDFEETIKKLWNNGDVEIGKLSDVVYTDDGIYVFFFAGKVGNLVGNADISENFKFYRIENIETLYEKQLNIFSCKTLFDKLYEELSSSDDFGTFRQDKLDEIKSKPDPNHPEKLTCVVTQYPDNYK